MDVQDNEDVIKQITKLVKVLDDNTELVESLKRLATANTGTVDTTEEIINFNNQIFKARDTLFHARIELEKIQKAMSKHVSHCLNPIPKTAPKGSKKSARKKEDALPKQQVDYMIDFIEKSRPNLDMNAIMPGKESHHPAKNSNLELKATPAINMKEVMKNQPKKEKKEKTSLVPKIETDSEEDKKAKDSAYERLHGTAEF